MKIIKIKRFGEKELIKRLKAVRMLKASKIQPYKDAVVTLENLDTTELYCPQKYIIEQNLMDIANLDWEMRKYKVDIFNLNGFVRFWLKDEKEPRDFLPVIVEESIEANGKVANLICDGMHRAYYARTCWKIPQVAFIRGIPKQYPYYNYPMYKGDDWDKLDRFPALPLPEGYIKKWTREENYKAYYKDFNSQFENVSVARSA
ncbi:MAG: hypothetical protein GF347_04360 [Candidatus Moranbacteria bacterium]|nr:hypothetical protein [Candidatus Moranbacteria bacterium]